MDRLDYRIRRGRQEAVDEMRARDWLRLGAPIALELSPEPAEGEQRSVVVQREPNDVLLFRFRVWLRRVFREAVCRDQATIFRLQPAAPVRRGSVADIGDGKTASARRRRHSPAHYGEFAFSAGIAHHGSKVVGEDTRHRRQVADVPIQHPEECDDGRLIRVML